MKSVGIKALKNKLSHYLRMVIAGEVVLVSDRDEVIAEIRKPLRMYRGGISRFETFVEDMHSRGIIQKPKGEKLFPRTKEDLPKYPGIIDAQKILDESREERS